ncbi:MAG: hypothetical protein HYZ71_07375 [Deltaproteobacteria bacterium]|nr:hypothetical protein [Deltaproteobacteria bacterium]
MEIASTWPIRLSLIPLKERFLDLILSLYSYNEYQGYRQLEGLIDELTCRTLVPDWFLEGMRKHANDEKKHYQMFKHYFANEGRMPFDVSRSIGQYDLLVRLVMGVWPPSLGERIFNEADVLPQLARLIIATEIRGLKEVRKILGWRWIQEHQRLKNIFTVIEADEPSHYLPYEAWLKATGARLPGSRERFWDHALHLFLSVCVIPVHFFNPFLKRRTQFQD